MKKVLVLLLTSLTVIVNAQRNNTSSEDPYAKIYEETHVGKRTSKCLKNLLLPNVFNVSFQTSPCNDFVERGNERLAQFEKFIDFFVSSEKDEKPMQAAQKKYDAETFKNEFENIDYRINYAMKQGTFTSDKIAPIENLVCKIKGSLQSIKAIKTYVLGVKKVFPNTASKVDEVVKAADDALAKYPDNKAIIASIKKNLNAELEEVSFPKPVTQNAEWEGWFKTWFSKNYSGYTILKQSLLTKDWYIKKNEISNLPEYRQIGTAIGAKAANGKCYIIKIDIFQDYIGGKFSASRFDEYDKKEILCENLK